MRRGIGWRRGDEDVQEICAGGEEGNVGLEDKMCGLKSRHDTIQSHSLLSIAVPYLVLGCVCETCMFQ